MRTSLAPPRNKKKNKALKSRWNNTIRGPYYLEVYNEHKLAENKIRRFFVFGDFGFTPLQLETRFAEKILEISIGRGLGALKRG